MCCDEIREVTADNEAGRFFAATGGCFWSKMQDHGRQNKLVKSELTIGVVCDLRRRLPKETGRQAGLRNALSIVLSSVVPPVKDVFG